MLSQTFYTEQTMNIVILGPGAIGTLWAYHLSQAGHQVSLWSRKEPTSLTLTVDNQSAVELENNNPQRLAQADLILITVKAWQVEQALLPILDYLNQDTMLLFMHNGMGGIESLAERLHRFPVLLATTSHGALLHAPGHVAHTGIGATFIGGANHNGNRCSFIADVFHHALPDVQWEQNINQALWNKLAINCAINPLTAIHQCKNGQLDSPAYKESLNKVIDEIHQVLEYEQMDIAKTVLTEKVYSVIHATAENLSSMHQDIFHHRPTEIDFITGYLIKRARIHNLAVPENEKLYNQIKELERNGTVK